MQGVTQGSCDKNKIINGPITINFIRTSSPEMECISSASGQIELALERQPVWS